MTRAALDLDAHLRPCEILRARLLADDASAPLAASDVPWETLIETANRQFVTPSLAWCCASDPAFPADARGYLEAILQLKTERNERAVGTLDRVTRTLNAAGIVAVPLKGAADAAAGAATRLRMALERPSLGLGLEARWTLVRNGRTLPA